MEQNKKLSTKIEEITKMTQEYLKKKKPSKKELFVIMDEIIKNKVVKNYKKSVPKKEKK